MSANQHEAPPNQQPGSLMAVVVSTALFFALTYLTSPRWLSVPQSTTGVLILTLAYLIPLFFTIVLPHSSTMSRILTLLFSAAAGISVFLHVGLSGKLVANMDAGFLWSKETVLIVLELVVSVTAIPLGLIVAHRRASKKIGRVILLPTLFGATGQILFFIAARVIQGPSGLEFWMAVRVVIMAAIGLTAGFFTFSQAAFKPRFNSPHLGGFTELLIIRLPPALPFSALIAFAIFIPGALRIAAERTDRGRFVTHRFDDYFLSLSNMTRARSAGLLYSELEAALRTSRNALFGAASFDSPLVERLKKMLDTIESTTPGNESKQQFEKSVMAVNRRLLSLGEPFFLEPHSLGTKENRLRFVLRYKIIRRGRYALRHQPSIPMLRLRRFDDIDIDTPYTGLSYPGIGTILMDHIEEVALEKYVPLFAKDAMNNASEDGKWHATLRILRRDIRDAILEQLEKTGLSLSMMSSLSEAFRTTPPRFTPFDLRRTFPPELISRYDRLTELIARQTETHETRHATDTVFNSQKVKKTLKSFTTHSLQQQTVAEIRAYLTEIIDGPLGPKFGLATVGRLIIEPGARANAYFFAAIIILEGMWGEEVRRPDIVEIEKEDSPIQVVMPISEAHPGWLSYSRIHGAYADLSALSDDILRHRALTLFKALFGETYIPVERRR